MTQPSGPTAPQRFVLRAELPFRALAIAAVSAIVGAVLLVLWGALELPALALVVGIVVLAFALAVTVAAGLAERRWRQTVLVEDAALTVSSRDSRRTLRWSDVKAVRLEGDRLVFTRTSGEQDPTEVNNPHGPSERTFAAMLSAISARLDADRGYHSLE